MIRYSASLRIDIFPRKFVPFRCSRARQLAHGGWFFFAPEMPSCSARPKLVEAPWFGFLASKKKQSACCALRDKPCNFESRLACPLLASRLANASRNSQGSARRMFGSHHLAYFAAAFTRACSSISVTSKPSGCNPSTLFLARCKASTKPSGLFSPVHQLIFSE